MIIYKTTNKINGKIYIGKDIYNNKKYIGSGLNLKSAIKKYGRVNFTKEVLEFCKDNTELNYKEKQWIKKLNATNPKIGYNISNGGQGGNLFDNKPNNSGWKHTEEFKENHRIIFSGENHPLFNKHHKVSTRIKISKANKKYAKSEEGKIKYKNIGEKIKIHHTNNKIIFQYTKENKFIKSFQNTLEIEKEFNGIHKSNILKCCKDNSRLLIKSSQGYKWSFNKF